MSRIRACLLATLAGILITAGGCADSATLPAAAAAGPSLDRAQGDSISNANRPSNGDGEITTQSNGFMVVGGRTSS
jgi:hypothetical protein